VSRRHLLPGLLLTLLSPIPAGADIVVLTSGRVIEADHAWYEGTELRYRRDGVLFALPRALVSRVDADPATALLDPDVLQSRDRLAHGDPGEALRFARIAVFRSPSSVPALQALGNAQLALGDAERAQGTAETALKLDPADPGSHELLGDALAELGEFVAARESYRAALAGGDRVRRKLASLGSEPASISSARFRIRYDGAADEPLGLDVLRVLDRAWEEYERRLGFTPGFPVVVVLQTARSFRDTTRAPEWVAAWNDGEIRIPVMGIEAPTPELVRVLRHELVHSFVASRTGTNCPTWLQEGLAQWYEGADPAREDAILAPLARAGRLPRLESLEQPFVGLSEASAAVAYGESLSIVALLARRGGEEGLRRLIDALAGGAPAAEALPTTYALSYPELQREWQAHLVARARSVREAGL
jgi:tetratricopeptide (TPR) repeat protein